MALIVVLWQYRDVSFTEAVWHLSWPSPCTAILYIFFLEHVEEEAMNPPFLYDMPFFRNKRQICLRRKKGEDFSLLFQLLILWISFTGKALTVTVVAWQTVKPLSPPFKNANHCHTDCYELLPENCNQVSYAHLCECIWPWGERNQVANARREAS